MTNFRTTGFVVALSLLTAVVGYAQKKPLKIKVTKLAKNVYVHTSYKYLGSTKFPSNGLIIKTRKGIWIIDTAWGDDQSKQLITWVKDNLRKPIVQVIATHSHDDRVGGIKAFQEAKIPVISTKLTAKRAVKAGNPSPKPILKKAQILDGGNVKIQVLHPGWGHSPDNMVVYLPKQKLLFGGCFVKSKESKDLGYTKEAHLKYWKKGLIALKSKFGQTKTVVPGHQEWGNLELLDHTMALLDKKLRR